MEFTLKTIEIAFYEFLFEDTEMYPVCQLHYSTVTAYSRLNEIILWRSDRLCPFRIVPDGRKTLSQYGSQQSPSSFVNVNWVLSKSYVMWKLSVYLISRTAVFDSWTVVGIILDVLLDNIKCGNIMINTRNIRTFYSCVNGPRLFTNAILKCLTFHESWKVIESKTLKSILNK